MAKAGANFKATPEGDFTLGKLYEGTTFCSDRTWFHTFDIWYRFSLTVFLHYFNAVTHPISYPMFCFDYLNTWYSAPVALSALCCWPVYPLWVVALEVGKRIQQLWKVDWTQAGPGSVFFTRPKGFVNSIVWDCYLNVSMMSAHFLYNGPAHDSIVASVKDVDTTKCFWRDIIFQGCGMRKAREMGQFQYGRLRMTHDATGVDIVAKIEDSFLGVGDKWLTYGKEFKTTEDLQEFCSENFTPDQLVLLLEIVRPDPLWKVHQLDIVTVVTTTGPKVLSVLWWGDCSGPSSHSSASGYCVDAKTGQIMTPVKWYSVSYANQNMSHIGRVIPGVEAACRKAIEAHTEVLKHRPWMKAVGWDCMLMKNDEWVWFEGNFAQARTPRRIFLTASNLFHAIKAFSRIPK